MISGAGRGEHVGDAGPSGDLVDDLADRAGRTAGLSRGFCPGHADAVPADHHPDLPLVGRLSSHGRRRLGRDPVDPRLRLPGLRRLLPADDAGPRLFQHARVGQRDRRAGSRRRDQEIPDSADRYARLLAADPRRPQAGLLLGGDRPVRAGVLPVPGILHQRLARRRRRCWPSSRRW